MSSTIWTARAVASDAASARFDLWRAVEAQHVVATAELVDTLDEQYTLERLLEESKPAVPPIARQLHWLLFTPFRYPPPPGGSRFRGPTDPGVFYGADLIRTACAELGYWRWRHLQDTPTLTAMPTKPQTLFRSGVATECVDLQKLPFARDWATWTRRDDYAACQRFARIARDAGVGAIRYESVRDPLSGTCGAVLSPAAFVPPVPLEQQTWMLSVTRDRVVWQRTGVLQDDEFEFVTAAWKPAQAQPRPLARRARRNRP